MARSIVLAIEIDTEAREIFRALTTEEGLTSFWTPDVTAVPEVGAKLRFGFAAAPVDLEMVVTSLEADRVVKWSCAGPWPGWEGTDVEWVIESAESGNRLVLLRHVGWSEDTSDVVIGSVALTWARVLVALEEHIRTGTKVPALE
jgi:uncharacterized protein YndB with AHSA1/START domain